MNEPLTLPLLLVISALLTLINLYIMYISVKILRVSEDLLVETIIIKEVSIDLKEIGLTQIELLKQMHSVKFGAGARWFEDHEQIATAMDGKKEGTFITTSRRSSATPQRKR